MLRHVKIVKLLNIIHSCIEGTCMVVWCFVNVSTGDIICSKGTLMFVL